MPWAASGCLCLRACQWWQAGAEPVLPMAARGASGLPVGTACSPVLRPCADAVPAAAACLRPNQPCACCGSALRACVHGRHASVSMTLPAAMRAWSCVRLPAGSAPLRPAVTRLPLVVTRCRRAASLAACGIACSQPIITRERPLCFSLFAVVSHLHPFHSLPPCTALSLGPDCSGSACSGLA